MDQVRTGELALLGRRVGGKFVVERSLGGGAMGAVYCARDEVLERRVAIKVMHPAVATDSSFVRRFRREARAASRLDHPNAVRVIELGEEPDGLLYIAMEYLDGRDLGTVIYEDWPLSDERIADVMMKALAALAAAHDKGVIHRDLKPENLMLLLRRDDEGHDIVKVCDFGIASVTDLDEMDAGRARTKLTSVGTLVGTPEYMSPEQARAETLDARSDLYSMGLILYQMLTGRTPFTGDTALEIVLKHISEVAAAPRTIRPGVHGGLEAVCMRSIAKEREERFQSARDMRAALKAAIEGRPMPVDTNAATAPDELQATRVVELTAPAPTSKRRAQISNLVHASLAIGVLGAVGAYVRREPAPAAPPRSTSVLATSIVPTPMLLEPAPTATPSSNAVPTPTARSEPRRQVRAPSTATRSIVTAAPPPPPPLESAPAAPSVSVESPSPETQSPPPPPPLREVTPAPFNSQACRAQLGAARSASTYSVKDLAMHGTDEVWTRCAKSSIGERPAGPIAAVVRVRFSDDTRFNGASCKGCALPLAACVASSTRGTVAVHVKSGDATGAPEFDIPVTFTCE